MKIVDQQKGWFVNTESERLIELAWMYVCGNVRTDGRMHWARGQIQDNTHCPHTDLRARTGMHAGLLTTMSATKYIQSQNEWASCIKYIIFTQPARLITCKNRNATGH